MFDVAAFQKLRKGNFGKDLFYFETLESTNLTAGELALQDAAEGTVVLANEQTGGKGRMNRSWFSPADQNLYFSLLLRPDSTRLHYLPFMAALAIANTVASLGIDADLKWPNDVLVKGKKLSGILMQTSTEKNMLRHAVLGIGINVNVRMFPPELDATATSVILELPEGSAVRESILASVLLDFERHYLAIHELVWSDFCLELESRSSYLRDCPVQVKEHDRILEGTTAGLDEFGGLILDTVDGRKIVYAGDVQSCRKN